MDLELTGKTAIVTGGSRGMGKAFARQLALEGVDVAIAARTRDRLEAAAKELSEETGRRIIPVQADTGDDDSVRNMVKTAVAALGHIDILVNTATFKSDAPNAPSLHPPTVDEFTTDLVWPDVNVKVLGYWRCAREVAPYMRKQRWGRIINIAGLGARESGTVVCGIRNAAVVVLSKNLADELGPHGINVTVVYPGITYGESVDAVLSDQQGREDIVRLQEGSRWGDPAHDDQDNVKGISREEAKRRITRNISIRRLVDQREVAYVVAFLASPKSVAINGDVIAAGGGDGRAIYF